MAKKVLIGLLILVLIAAAALQWAPHWWGNRPLVFSKATVSATIPVGATGGDVAQLWVDAGVQASPWLLAQWFRWTGESRKIRAGTYEIEQGTTPIGLLDRMVRGLEATASVRFIEGWSFRQLRMELARAPSLKLTSGQMSDAQIMAAIGAPQEQHPEGRFFPDTYVYQRGATDLSVLKAAYRAMQQNLLAVWAARSADTPLKSTDELLILASIVEKETAHGADRGLVSGVFNNRLKRRMPLQTDPTVIYGLGEKFDGNLRKRDLQTDNAYNTYMRVGLPPTPISLPGMASLLAAMNPQPTKALFFVARGDGSSEFSETLSDHNRAVDRYQRGRP